jgi:IclR family acetate operon transcriptional repressor
VVDRQRSGTQAIDRALGLLRVFENADSDLGITALASACGLSVSTTHRLVKALAAAGLVAQDPQTERYHLGASLVTLGRRAEVRLGLAGWTGVLEELAQRTGESASLGTRVGGHVLIAAHVPSAQPLRFDAGTGSRVPIHASAMGKMLLAATDDPAAEIAGLGPLERFTERTFTDPDRLLAELVMIRRRGWSLNDGERHDGVRAVAVAIPVATGLSRSAMAVQGPALRLTDDRLDQTAAVLLATVSAANG